MKTYKRTTIHVIKKLNPVQVNLLSDELYNKIFGLLNENIYKFDLCTKTKLIHLADAVSRGYVLPMEAYDALRIGYVPENLTIRNSAYVHLL